MAISATVTKTLSLGGTETLYAGTIAFDASYATGGEALDVGQNERIDFLLCQPAGGYVYNWDAANQKLVVYYVDNNAASDSALIQVPDTTDISALTATPFIAIGQ